ncbi:MAG: glycosyltransferase family 4 protein [Ferruginibacter sp.]
MKIIIVNYRFFISGGPERYLFNIIELLQKKGHIVIPFSIKHNKNEQTTYERYFLDPIGDGNEVYASEYDKTNINTLAKTVSRMWYSVEAKRKLEILIKDVDPDLIYVLHYQNKISPSIFDAAIKFNVPVVHRISDFGQICANSLLFRPRQKDLCERCLNGSKWNAVKNKCVQDSYVYSAIKAMSLVIAERVVDVKSKISAYVIPSSFTLHKLAEYGLDRKKLYHIPTFFNTGILEGSAINLYLPFALYIGRIVQEKGLFTLISAFVNTNFNLKIIGFSDSAYQQELEKYLEGKQHNIEFLGRKTFGEIAPYLQTCAFTIVPSETYDNFPNSILESYAYKKPVIATNLGSLREMVVDRETGLLFNMQDVADLQEKIAFLLNDPGLCEQYGINGYIKLQEEFGAEKHYQKLMKVFNSVLKNGEKEIKTIKDNIRQ